MKKSVVISLIALGVSVIGLIIALAAWVQKKRDLICDDFDDDLLTDDDEDEYIASQYAQPPHPDYDNLSEADDEPVGLSLEDEE